MQPANPISTEALASASRALAPHGTGDASRLVIRDESKQETLASNESAPAAIDRNYEPETFDVKWGKRGAIVTALPVADKSITTRIAHIDWLAFTIKPESESVNWLMSELKRLIGFDAFRLRKSGLYGYEQSADIEEGGLIAWGGNNQRGTVYVSLNAQGCARIQDWQVMREWLEMHQCAITRVDLAHDDFKGETVTIKSSRQWYDQGGFNSGGRMPSSSLSGDWWGGEKGCTVYIGARGSGKLLRIYEKGKQQGDPQSPWVRVELELHNKSRWIPYDALTKPAAYLAGSFACLKFLSAEQCKVKTISKGAKTAYVRAVKVARVQYGKLVNLMLQVNDGDYAAVVDALKRDGLPSKLEPYSYSLRNEPQVLEAMNKSDGHDPLVD